MSGLNAGADVSESGDPSLGTVTGAVTVGPRFAGGEPGIAPVPAK
jgi:hypothetical protein